MLRALPRAAAGSGVAGAAADLPAERGPPGTLAALGGRHARLGARQDSPSAPRGVRRRLLPEPSRVLVHVAARATTSPIWRGAAITSWRSRASRRRSTPSSDVWCGRGSKNCRPRHDYDGDDVRGALATMHVVRLPLRAAPSV